MSARDPLPQGARTEIERLARRWQQLPLDRALARVHLVRDLAQAFADESAALTGLDVVALPDLGPATSLDQLHVTAYDLARARTDAGADLTDIETRLADLRREI